MRIASLGHAVFAATMIALGLVGLVRGDFAAIWQPVPGWVPARQLVAYLCAFISLASGAALLWRRTAGPAARVLVAYLFLWMLLFKVPHILDAPMVAVSYESWGETAVLVAAAWGLYACFATDWDRQCFGFATGDRGLRIARTIYGLALIAFGLAHFAYVNDTAALVPRWLPSPQGWVYFTGSTYVAFGVALISGAYAWLAASLAALQTGIFTLLVWLPVVASGHADASQWDEFMISCAITAGAWVVADSYRTRDRAKAMESPPGAQA